MKKDRYLITLQKIEECLECGEGFGCNPVEIENAIVMLKYSCTDRIKFLEKVITTLEIEKARNKNILEVLKQTPKDILRASSRMLKNANSIATPTLHPLIKEFNQISKAFAADYVALLEKKGIK